MNLKSVGEHFDALQFGGRSSSLDTDNESTNPLDLHINDVVSSKEVCERLEVERGARGG